MAIGLALLHRWIVIRKNTNKANVILQGSASWAGKEDIEKTGLLGNSGNETGRVIVDGWEDKKRQLHYLKHFGSEHVLTVAPTRSDKGVGLIITYPAYLGKQYRYYGFKRRITGTNGWVEKICWK